MNANSNKEFDILVVGELNVDLILNKIQSFPKIGTEILADEMTLTLGSSSAIFASNSVSLGSKVAFLGLVGKDDFGNFVCNSLKDKNVDTRFVKATPDHKTGITVALNYGEQRAMVTHPGAMNFLSMADVSPEILSKARHLHISSVFLQPLIQRDIVEIFSNAKKLGLTTSLDTQWDPSEKWNLNLEKLLPFVDVFIPNEDEALALTKSKNVDEALSKLNGFANIVVVKCGNKGSIGFKDGKIHRAEPFLNTHVVDAIGAGDSFDAGFVTQFLKGKNLDHCLRMGNLAGALNTTAAGGTAAFSDKRKMISAASEKFHVNLNEML